MYDIETLRDLRDALNKLDEKILDLPLQVVNSSAVDGIEECVLGISFGRVHEFEFYGCRSVHNNKYCANDYIIYVDGNPFAKDGAVAYEFKGSFDDMDPIYGKDGPTPEKDQINPDDSNKLPQHVIQIINKRSTDMEDV